MKRYKSLFVVLLTIVAFGFIVFVAIMQKNFNNPVFADLPQAENINTNNESNTQDGKNTDSENDTVAGAAGSIVHDENDTEEETDLETDSNEDGPEVENEIISSTQTVTADTLNARTGPGIDYEIAGVLVENQEVEVEDSGDDWVKVITDEFTGYVNKNYLSGD